MIKIGYICPNGSDATSLYRAVGPFQEIHHSHPEYIFEHVREISWHTLGYYDIIFMQRPATISDISVIRMIKNLNKPLWIDYDDDLFSVPIDNPSFLMYRNPAIHQNVVDAIKYADVVTVSTQTLKDKLINKTQEKEDKFVLVHNAFNNHLFTRNPPNINRKPLIMWRGSQTHVQDLLECKSGIELAANQYEDYSWLFIGQIPWMLNLKSGTYMHAEPMEPITYMKFLKEVDAELFIVPLVDSEFNRAKSNIAWIEATYSGALCISAPLPEFQVPGCINYSDKNIDQTINEVMSLTKEEKQNLVEESWQYINDNLLLTTINKKRVDVIKSLSSKK